MNFQDLLDEYESRYGVADLESWNTLHLSRLHELVEEELISRAEFYGDTED